MKSTNFAHLNVTESNRIVTVELNHGRANEMGSEQLAEWERLSELLETEDVRALITWSKRLSKKGKPIFIAGANVTERAEWSDEQVRSHVRWQRQTLRRLRRSPVFHIGVVDGIALGWGTEFLLTCDYRIAGPGAVFGLPETSLGILPGAGGTSDLWMEIGIAQALRLGMTGEQIDGSEALRIGLIQEQVERLEDGLSRAQDLAARVARRSPTAVTAYKTALLAAIGSTSSDRVELEAQAYEACLDSGDAAIGRSNFRSILAGEDVQWGPRRSFSP